MNLANKLTLLRVIMVLFFMVFLLIDGIPYNYLWAGIVFALASLTDFADGKIARKYNMITDFGKFLDPLADKVLVVCALVCFIQLGWAKAWVICVIIAREFMVSGVRLVAAGSAEKTVIAAGILGKLKTASTMISIVVILILQILIQFGVSAITDMGADIQLINDILLYISMALTVLSGIQYMWQYRAVFKSAK